MSVSSSGSPQPLSAVTLVCLKRDFRGLPAAKCRGVDFRPAISLAFTLTASTSFFTLDTSPFRQASNSSLNAPFAPPPPPLLLLPPLPGLPLPESGVEPGLVPLPSVVVGELALLLVLLLLPLLLLLLAVRARAGEVVVGEAGATSPSAAFSIAPRWGSGVTSSAGAGGEPGGVPGREEPRGGEDSREFGCCCCCCCWEVRRGVAIFTTQQSPLATKTLLTASCPGESHFRSDHVHLCTHGLHMKTHNTWAEVHPLNPVSARV